MARYEVWAWRVLARMRESTPEVSLWDYNMRDNTLRKEGFLYWERFWLAQHDIDSPGMRYMRRERVRMRNAFGITFENWNEWQRRIRDWYIRNNWRFKDGRMNPFAMLEWFKQQSSSPDTPQPKRPSRPKDFLTAKQMTMTRRHPLDVREWSDETKRRHKQRQEEAARHMARIKGAG